MRAATKHFLALALVLVSSAWFVAARTADQTTTAPIGGTGGVPYHVGCGPGEVLVGLVMRATPAKVPLVQWLESAYPVCSKVDASGRWIESRAHYPELSVG